MQELEKARLATQTAQSRVEAVKVEIEKTIIRAPIGGIITRRSAKLGSGIVRGDKLFEVAQLSPLEVRFQLPQFEQKRLSPGSLIGLSLIGSDQIVARARIRRIDPVADATSNALGYLADVLGSQRLLVGTAVNVHVPQAAAATIWLPRVAFPPRTNPQPGTTNTVLVVDGNACAARAVAIHTVEGDQVEISSGLMPGDRVILAPAAELKAGDLIEVKKN